MIVIFYLDASCLLRRLLRDGMVLERWSLWDIAVASEIAKVEVHRTLDRMLRTRSFSTESHSRALVEFSDMERSIRWLPVTSEVIDAAAGPLPTIVKALDAIHISTAVRVRDAFPGLVLATHDRQMATAAVALGFPVEGYDFTLA
jgi:predicted nucleic acid-binding protein